MIAIQYCFKHPLNFKGKNVYTTITCSNSDINLVMIAWNRKQSDFGDWRCNSGGNVLL